MVCDLGIWIFYPGMEETDQKSLTIGDILDQLIKPSAIQVPGAPPPRSTQTGPTPSISLPSSQKIETSSEIRLPSLGKDTGSPAFSSPSLDTQQPSELKLSIRTMSADLARLKQGQRPLGQEVKKPIGQEVKRPIPAAPPTPQPRIRTESQILPRPQAIPQIPKIFKPGPAPIPAPQRSAYRPAPQPPPSTTLTPPTEPEHHHKERIISQDMLPPFLGAPVPRKKPIKPPDEKVEYGLIARVIGSGMTTGIISTVAVAVAIFLLLRFFVFNQGGLTVPTPTPAQIEPTPIAEINELETIFRTVSAANFAVPEDKQQTLALLESFKTTQVLAKKEFRRINFIPPLGQTRSLNFTDILNSFSVPFPSEFKDSTKDNYMVFLYGQEELFNQEEVSFPGIAKRMVIIVEIKDTEKSKELLGRWESTLAKDFEKIFGLDIPRQASQLFLDNERRGVKIHYKNFPLPDRSLDYAIITSPAGRSYLILTNSRESMYSPADKIQGF